MAESAKKEYLAVARLNDRVNTGHPCDTSTTIVSGNTGNVYVNKVLAAIVGSRLAEHTINSGDKCIPHPEQKVNSSSARVYINKIAVARVTDSADLGTIASGSQNVFTSK